MQRQCSFNQQVCRRLIGIVLATLACVAVSIRAQTSPAPKPHVTNFHITSPKEQFGHEIGDDYWLADYKQAIEYWRKLAKESDRMTIEEIGKTAEDRPQMMAIVTSPSNRKNLQKYKDIAARLARAEGLTDGQARALAKEGKAVVWVDGGIHASEVLSSQQLLELTYDLVSRNDPETLRILNDDIVLLVWANPDGMDIVSDWYMREPDPKKRTDRDLPRLYEKYAGHDVNRDFFMMNLPESTNINRVMYREWHPEIVYNPHQTGPKGAVLFVGPFRDPFNYNLDPLSLLELDLVGSAVQTRLAEEGKRGVTTRSVKQYSTWASGGLRPTTYFHNVIGELTETIGNPTPEKIPLEPDLQLPHNDDPFPVPPTDTWHFKQSIDYSISSGYAILSLAAKMREDFLFNIYRMGKNSIERGSQDSWTISPQRIDALKAAATKDSAVSNGEIPTKLYQQVLQDPAFRDPRGYILPSDQPDFLTATKFVSILQKAGVEVDRATTSFAIGNKTYPAGSYIVKSAQALRPYLRDMFEAQDHPTTFPGPNQPPDEEYDAAGYTLAFQMGIKFDRILDDFHGPFERLNTLVTPPRGRVNQAPTGGGYLLSHEVNDSFIAVNRLLAHNQDIYWIQSAFQANGKSYPAGTMFIPSKPTTFTLLERLAVEKGLSFETVSTAPAGASMQLRPVRIGLWDQYGGSMPSGWIRWILEQYEFPFEVVYPKRLDAGHLADQFDVLIFPSGAIPSGVIPAKGGDHAQPDPATIPMEYRDWLGVVTIEHTVPELKKFVEQGGTLLAIGSSTAIGYDLKLPIADALVEGTPARPLPPLKFYVPPSIFELRVDTTNPVGFGIGQTVDAVFDSSPAFRLLPEAAAERVRRVAWYDSPTSLRSGEAWGQQYLKQAAAIVEAPLGNGRVLLFGPEITWRAEPQGTFKFLFNGIYSGSATIATDVTHRQSNSDPDASRVTNLQSPANSPIKRAQ